MADRPKMSVVDVVAAAIIRADRCLVAQRGPGMRLAGQWEFPGGKVEAGETFAAALRREIEEELGITIAVGPQLGQNEVTADGRPFRLTLFAAEWTGGHLTLTEHAEAVWLTAEALPKLRWAVADIPLIPAVAARLAGSL